MGKPVTKLLSRTIGECNDENPLCLRPLHDLVGGSCNNGARLATTRPGIHQNIAVRSGIRYSITLLLIEFHFIASTSV
ncbi:hypothetical protein SDC9_170248 [bioreactor metagenome]|uniref:Uncharacterized protein n=1 Tax=bioreactor metagenome TaxID=1076179 RepID=A0A645GGK4_9ZZZZ